MKPGEVEGENDKSEASMLREVTNAMKVEVDLSDLCKRPQEFYHPNER